jgi:hypothetical protein
MRRWLLSLLITQAQPLLAEPVVIGHPGLRELDLTTLQRIYTGKVIEVGGIRVFPVNLGPGDRLRQRFLERYLKQDEAAYVGYWTVRRYVGKGSPPRELGQSLEVIQFVTRTAGAIGYVDEKDLREGLNVLRRSP